MKNYQILFSFEDMAKMTYAYVKATNIYEALAKAKQQFPNKKIAQIQEQD